MAYPLTVRSNNPGAIMGNYFGAMGTGAGGHAIYPSMGAGWKAMEEQLGRYRRGDFSGVPITSVRETVDVWSGGENADEYVNAVSSQLGIDPDEPVPEERLPDLMSAMASWEAGQPMTYGEDTEGSGTEQPSTAASGGSSHAQSMALMGQAAAAPLMGAAPDVDQAGIQQAVKDAMAHQVAPVGSGTEPDMPVDDGLFLGPLGRMGLAILAAPGRGGNWLQAVAGGIQQYQTDEQQLQNSLLRREREMAETRSRLSAQARQEDYRANQRQLMESDAFSGLNADDQMRAMAQLSSLYADDPLEAMQRIVNTENMITQRQAPAQRAALQQSQMQQRFAQEKALLEDRQSHAREMMERNATLQQAGRVVLTEAEEAEETTGPPVKDGLTADQYENALSSWDTIQQMPENTQKERTRKTHALVNWKSQFGEGLNAAEQAIQSGTFGLTPKQREERRMRDEAAVSGLDRLAAMADIVAQGTDVTGITGQIKRKTEPWLGDILSYDPGIPAFNHNVRMMQEQIIPTLNSFKGTLTQRDQERLEAITGVAIQSQEGLQHVMSEAQDLFRKLAPDAVKERDAIGNEFMGYIQSGQLPPGSRLKRAPEYNGYIVIGPNGQPFYDAQGNMAVITGE